MSTAQKPDKRSSKEIAAEMDKLAEKEERTTWQDSERWNQLNMDFQLKRATGR